MKDHQEAHQVFEGLCDLMKQEHEKVLKAEISTKAEFLLLSTEVSHVISAYNEEIGNLLDLGIACIGLFDLIYEIQMIAIAIGTLLNEYRQRLDDVQVGKVAFVDMLGDKPKVRTWN